MHSRSAVTIAALGLAGIACTTGGAVAATVITSSNIKDGTILRRDMAFSAVAAIRATYQKKVTITILSGQNKGYSAACNTGDRAIGGGFKPDGPGVLSQGSYPYASTGGNAWVQQMVNTSGTTRSVEVYAVCFDR